MVTTALPVLTFGVGQAFDLTGQTLTESGAKIEASTDLDFGTLEANVTDIPSRIMDGQLGYIDSFGNRVLTLFVRISGTGTQMTACERDLMRECSRTGWTELLTKSRIAGTHSGVFDVVTAVLDFQFSDADDRSSRWVYKLTLTVLPFIRSASGIAATIASLATTDVSVLAYPITSATNWSAWGGGPSVVAGARTINTSSTAITAQAGPSDTWLQLSYRPTSAITVNRQFIAIEVNNGNPLDKNSDTTNRVYINLGFNQDGSAILPGTKGLDYVSTATISGRTFYYFRLPAGTTTLTSLTIYRITTTPRSISSPVSSLTLTDNASGAGTGKFSNLILDVPGSARSEVAINIAPAAAAATTALGLCLIHTDPTLSSSFARSYRAWRTSSGTVTADATKAISGSYESVGNSASNANTATIPGSLVPDGTYVLYGLLRGATGTVFNMTTTVATTAGATSYGTQSRTSSFTGTGTAADYTLVPLGTFLMASQAPDGTTNTSLTVKLYGTSGTQLDDIIFIRVAQDCGLTIVDCGTGTATLGSAYSQINLEPPSRAWPLPRIRLGVAGDGSDLETPDANRIKAWGSHKLAPGTNGLLVATSNMPRPIVSAAITPRWHSHPGEVA